MIASRVLMSLLAISFFSPVFSMAAELHCTRFLSASEGSPADDTNDFIQYLARLLEERVIGAHHLIRLADSAKRGVLQNPIIGEEATRTSAALLHREILEAYLTSEGAIDVGRISDWTLKWLQKNTDEQKDREKVQNETKVAYTKMAFHPIPKGVFKKRLGCFKALQGIWNEGDVLEFELMSTPVTRGQWWTVMGTYPTVLDNPDHPITGVTIAEVTQFIAQMNRTNDGYQYRLPTELEWDYVISNLGTVNPAAYFRTKEFLFEKHAWSNEKSTQPVATKAPMIIAGREFFDLFGNVRQFVDRHGEQDSSSKLLRGTAFLEGMSETPIWTEVVHPDRPASGYTGFRLARTRRVP